MLTRWAYTPLVNDFSLDGRAWGMVPGTLQKSRSPESSRLLVFFFLLSLLILPPPLVPGHLLPPESPDALGFVFLHLLKLFKVISLPLLLLHFTFANRQLQFVPAFLPATSSTIELQNALNFPRNKPTWGRTKKSASHLTDEHTLLSIHRSECKFVPSNSRKGAFLRLSQRLKVVLVIVISLVFPFLIVSFLKLYFHFVLPVYTYISRVILQCNLVVCFY